MDQKTNTSVNNALIANAWEYVKSIGLPKIIVRKNLAYWKSFSEFVEKRDLSLLCEKAPVLFANYLSKGKPHLLNSKKPLVSSIKLLQEFLKTGEIISLKAIGPLHGEIGAVMKEYIAERTSEHLKESTIKDYQSHLSRFFAHLSNNDIHLIKEIKIEHILCYIKHIPSKSKTNTYIAIGIIRRFLTWLFRKGRIAVDLSIKAPNVRYDKQPILPSVYNREEIERTLKNGIDRGYPAGKRNYLALLLAAHLGLRSSDICNLRFENILWDTNIIRLEQVKTGKILELPLVADIGNAIIDYLKHGRPKSNEPYILLTANAPINKMTASGVYVIITSAFKRAGVNTSNRKHGPHALRHSLAARMLEGKSAYPVISEVLGHENIDSTMYYIRIDTSSLSTCMLDSPSLEETFYQQFKWKK